MSWILLAVIVIGCLSYFRASLSVWTISGIVGLFLFSMFSSVFVFGKMLAWIVFAVSAFCLNFKSLRQQLISRHLLKFFQQVMPPLSETEEQALAAGTVGWDAELFKGQLDWNKLFKIPSPKLTQEEIDFLDGPVETLCQMIDDWDITYRRKDLPPELWQYIKEQGFFALIIPKKYGGKEFSALAHSQVIVKISSRSVTVSSTVSVPNSLGPGELLLNYGTEEQKDYYLPRLAAGIDIPCFALTGPDAGSDASNISDYGIVCKGQYQGREVTGIKLNFSKRYITLAPVATLIGLAFKLYDPNHLISDKEELGITVALIPRETPGLNIGRRHYPLDIPFQNGPIFGEDVFIPLDAIIGGVKNVGRGWQMLLECLACGRAISLPSTAVGAAKAGVLASGAYARIRQQFNMPIGKFDGVAEVLARLACNAYTIDALRLFTVNSIDQGEHPAVASAIAKYHSTERGRQIAQDVMDIHGGKGICMGPKNYTARAYQSVPISITVEGANILTRCMIIFGQGAVRCHPFVLDEMKSLKIDNSKKRLKCFDDLIFKHIGFTVSNFTRSLVLGLTDGKLVMVPEGGSIKRYLQKMERYSSGFALLVDTCLMTLGGSLKRRELLSARLGDILSNLYILSCVLKHFINQGAKEEDKIVVDYCAKELISGIEIRFEQIFQNLPNRILATILKLIIFPFGRHAKLPKDNLIKEISELTMAPNSTRRRITSGIYAKPEENNPIGKMDASLNKIISAEPLEKLIAKAIKNKKISGKTVTDYYQNAVENKVITTEEFHQLMEAYHIRQDVIAVDHFAPNELTSFLNKSSNNALNRSEEGSITEVY